MVLFFRLITLFLAGAATAAAQDNPSALQRTLIDPDKAAVEKEPESGEDAPQEIPTEVIEAITEQQALRKAVSQLMIVSLEGTTGFTTADRRFLERYTPGGIIIRTAGRPTFAADYVTEIRELGIEQRTGVPFLIGADLFVLPRRDRLQEKSFAQFPTLLSIAAAGDSTSTKRFAEFCATYLNALGFNMHIGPSLALAPALPSAPGTVDCLGSDPGFAAEAASDILSIWDDKGIIGLPMHFPGGQHNVSKRGAAPVLLTSQQVLAKSDLKPYAAAIEAGTRIMHVGTVMVPTIDSTKVPASLSPVVINQLLRQDLGFGGVVVAGPVDAPHIMKEFAPSDAAIISLAAGADMFIWHGSLTRVAKTVDDIVAAVQAGRLSQERIEESVARVAAMKEHYNLLERPMPDVDAARKLERKDKMPEQSYEIERKAITLLHNRNQTLPLDGDRSVPILVTGVAGIVDLHEALADHFKRKPVFVQPIVSAKHAGRIHDFEIDRITKRAAGLKTAVCLFDTAQAAWGQVEIVRKLKAKGVRVVVVLVGYPDTVDKFQMADAVVLAYAPTDYIDQTVPAVVDVLVGNAPVRVLAPVREFETQVGKVEEYNAYHVLQSPAGRFPISLEGPYQPGLSVKYSVDDTVKKVEWDFGNGKREKGFVVERAYEKTGRYPITLTVVDKNGQVSQGTFYAEVTE